MRAFTRMLMFAVLLVVPAHSLLAQTAVDPSGHWVGAVQVRNTDLTIEIDLAKNGKGDLAGTFGQPEQGVKGLPLSTVALQGRSVRFVVKADVEPSTFEGEISADGESIAGDVSIGDYVLPFRLTWTGVARIAPSPKSSPIGKEFEGTWNATLDDGARRQRIVLKMANQSDGIASGTIVSLDGSGVEIPIAMSQKGSTLTIDVTSVGVSYAGVLNPAGTELAGTWTQGPSAVNLTFRRANQ